MARPRLGNKLRAVADLVKILLARTPDLDAYERSQNQPILRAPKYGLDNEQWLTPHSDEAAYGPNSAFNEGHLQSHEEHRHPVVSASTHQAVA